MFIDRPVHLLKKSFTLRICLRSCSGLVPLAPELSLAGEKEHVCIYKVISRALPRNTTSAQSEPCLESMCWRSEGVCFSLGEESD